ncbi:MAG: DUF1553 domain-containing protein [Pirellulaceae bacterium]|nr:DUF1553 domain-containing protein [Pirellulaceae bacterium]
MNLAVVLVLAAATAAQEQAAAASPISAFESDANPVAQGRIDELVLGRLKQLGIPPARVCSDGVFVRRAYLDVIGTLPTPDEAAQFLNDSDPDRRRKLIDRLLDRDEFADYGAMKWCDLLRVKSEFPIKLWPNAVQAYHHWIHTAVKENMPYDRFARELLTASGSNFRVPQVNFYRAVQSREPQALAQAVAFTFMGVRPEAWPSDRWSGMAAFFSQISYKPTVEWKEEIVLFDLEQARSPAGMESLRSAAFPDASPVRLAPGEDPRRVFADWLIRPENPWFTRNVVNRVWFWLLGRGVIHPADDLRPDNPPANPELLDFLEQELIEARYDLKHLYRQILNSTTYQLSCVPRSDNPLGEANFAHYPLRRLEAEVLIDALCQITGTTEQYSSIIPEPYTFMPADQRAVALADASIASPFLEKFGRSSRDTGLESDRNNRPTAAQRLHMLNSSHVRQKMETSPKLRALLGSDPKRPEIIVQLYLTVLSRMPTQEELQIAETHVKETWADGGPRDLFWALVNSPEFCYRH